MFRSYRIFVLITVLSACAWWTAGPANLCAQQAVERFKEQPLWENSQIFRINKMPPRSSGWSCADQSLARVTDYQGYKNSGWVKSLNGQWDFRWFSQVRDARTGGLELAQRPGDWKSIQVPGHFELQGFGTPIYRNIGYCFKIDPPRVSSEPEENYTTFKERTPVGIYRREFQVDSDWHEGKIYLHFGGVSSALELWVNGRYVGYSQGSRLPAEFDLTDFVVPGQTNTLICKVYRWCDGSYLEDQDMWRLSGIYRDVFLYHQPKTHLWDVYPDAGFSLEKGKRQGQFQVSASVRNSHSKAAEDLQLKVTLYDGPDSEQVVGEFSSVARKAAANSWVNLNTQKISLADVQPWSHESPRLYTAVVQLMQGQNVLEARRYDVGFRDVKVTDQGLTLNGQPIKIRGVNRHEHDAQFGNHVPVETMLKDIRLMKQANVNAVRTSHYPNDPVWYQLCDRHGLLVLDEVNIESHGISYHKNVLPGDSPEWAGAAVDRMRSMVIRDRGHASIIMWSLGNEAGHGDSFRQMAGVCRDLDAADRPIQYADMNNICEFASQTYPTNDWLIEFLSGVDPAAENYKEEVPYANGLDRTSKPFLMNEYAHAMGNSVGNLSDYWDLILKEDRLVGGFIWDWVDQGLEKKMSDQSTQLVYGGAFGDFPNDDNFCMNGLIQADRIPHPHYFEVAHVYSPIRVRLASDGKGVVFENRFAFTNLDRFNLEVVVNQGDAAKQSFTLPPLSVAPSSTLEMPWSKLFEKLAVQSPVSAEKPALVNFYFRHANPVPWANADHIVSRSQLRYGKSDDVASKPTATSGTVTIDQAADSFRLRWSGGQSKKWLAEVDVSDGLLSRLSCDGQPLVAKKLKPNFWRNPTDNDLGWKWPEKRVVWKQMPEHLVVQTVSAIEGDTKVKAVLEHPPTSTRVELVYFVDQQQKLCIDYRVELPSEIDAPPRVGLMFSTPLEQAGQIRWLGRGPHENYLDRKFSALIDTYSAELAQWNHQYPRPQESGHRSDVSWFEIAGGTGQKFRVAANGKPFGLNVALASGQQQDSKSADSTKSQTDIFIDCLQMGVGGDTSWNLPVRKEYQLQPGQTYQTSFSLDLTN